MEENESVCARVLIACMSGLWCFMASLDDERGQKREGTGSVGGTYLWEQQAQHLQSRAEEWQGVAGSAPFSSTEPPPAPANLNQALIQRRSGGVARKSGSGMHM